MKKTLCILLSFALVLGLCACSSAPDDETSTEVEVIVDKVIYDESKTESVTDNVSSNVPVTS